MRAMILAAGRGERMGELTRAVPKPLLKLNGQYLIEYSLQALARAGIRDIVINVCYQKEMIIDALGTGARYGVNIEYSAEEVALETGGGIAKALPLLGDQPFLVISSDIITDYPLQNLPKEPLTLAHLVLVDNPVYHPAGDFCLYGRRIYYGKGHTLTFGNIGIYRPELFENCPPGKFRLTEIFRKGITMQQIDGEHYQGNWFNIGTPEEIENAQLVLSG
jgi:MurNAc alpha-1-phosphate uridylyltransferase